MVRLTFSRSSRHTLSLLSSYSSRSLLSSRSSAPHFFPLLALSERLTLFLGGTRVEMIMHGVQKDEIQLVRVSERRVKKKKTECAAHSAIR